MGRAYYTDRHETCTHLTAARTHGRYCQAMSRSVEGNWVLGEAEALLDMDGRRERLELVVAGLQSGRIQPVGHATARERIEKRIRDRRTR